MILGESRLKFAHAMKLYVFSRFENAITLARNNIFPFSNKDLVDDVLLHKKQSKSKNRPNTPGPLKAEYGLQTPYNSLTTAKMIRNFRFFNQFDNVSL